MQAYSPEVLFCTLCRHALVDFPQHAYALAHKLIWSIDGNEEHYLDGRILNHQTCTVWTAGDLPLIQLAEKLAKDIFAWRVVCATCDDACHDIDFLAVMDYDGRLKEKVSKLVAAHPLYGYLLPTKVSCEYSARNFIIDEM